MRQLIKPKGRLTANILILFKQFLSLFTSKSMFKILTFKLLVLLSFSSCVKEKEKGGKSCKFAIKLFETINNQLDAWRGGWK